MNDEIPPWIDDLVSALEKLHRQQDRATLARLRRSAGRELGEDPLVLRDFYRLLYGPRDRHAPVPAGREEDCYLVASLFPLAPDRWGSRPPSAEAGDEAPRRRPTDFGSTLRRLAEQPGVNADGLDRRLTVLLDADRRELPFRLRQAVRMLGQKDVRVDWRRLLRDLERWNWPSRPVQKQWARSYFGMQHDLEDPAATDAAPLVGDRPAEETRHVD